MIWNIVMSPDTDTLINSSQDLKKEAFLDLTSVKL